MSVDSFLVVLLLGLNSLCAIVMTTFLWSTTQDLRRTLKRINTVLPHGNQVFLEARRTLGEARQLLARTNKATHQVEEVIHRTRDAVLEIFDQWAAFRGRAQAFLAERFGNGARSGSRRQYRR